MTEDDAQQWLATNYPDALGKLQQFVAMIRDEAKHQNLVAASTLDSIWSRHIVDSAQLCGLVPGEAGSWLDVGAGAGFPGIVVAIIGKWSVELVEPRRRRAKFLGSVITGLGLTNAKVTAQPVERTSGPAADVISARAVASLEQLLVLTTARRASNTSYLLPKGASAVEEVERARRTWHGLFHVEHSITRADSFIVTATGVAPCIA